MLGDDAPVDVRHLGHAPHAEHPAARIPVGQGAASFQGHAGVSLHVQGLAQDQIGAAQGLVDVAAGDGVGGDGVRPFRLEEQCSARLGGRPRVDEHGEGLVLYVHHGQRVLCAIAVVGQDGGHRLADVADLVVGQRALQKAAHLAALGQTHGDDAGQLRHVVEGDHVDDAGAGARGGHVDAADPRVSVRAPHHGEVQRIRAPHVGDVGAAALQETLVLAPLEALAHVAHSAVAAEARSAEAHRIASD